MAVQEEARNWLERPAPAAAAPEPAAPNIKIPDSQSLEALKTWLATGVDLPLAGKEARRILPHGPEQAEIMLFSDAPASEDAGSDQPIGGAAWQLTEKMLAAIGFTPDQAYSASLSCMYAPGKRMSAQERDLCAEIARRHIRLARPKRILLLGDGPSQALLGKPLTQARGHPHKVEGIRTVATFHPRHLINQPSSKALAWRDLLLLMEDER
jgi:DNA polymerase